MNGGTGSYLGSQGQIIGSGTVGIKASDSITTHGGTIQSGSDLAMQASTINIGAAQLNAAASSVTHASDGTLKFNGNQTLNYGTTITSGGNAILQSTGGDLTLAGSNLSAQGSVSLASAGSIGLNAVTNSGFSDVKGHKSGTFNSSSFQKTNAYTIQQGSSIRSNSDVTMVAKHDISLAGSVVLADRNTSLLAGNDINLAGTITGQNDVSLTAGNVLTTTALKDTTSDYYHKNKSGIGASFSGGMASVGYMSDKRKDTSKTTTWTPSEISAGHNLSTVSGGASTFTGTNLSAGNDLSISGSSVNFNTVQNTLDQTYKHSSVFAGVKVGVSSDSAAGQAAQYGQAAADMNGAGSAAGKTLNAMQGGYAVGNAIANKGAGYSGGLISGTAQLGFSSSKYKSEYSQSNVVGSSATAGNSLSITARGDNANDAHNGDITATAAKISGSDVLLSGNNVTLQNGWDTTHSSSKGHSIGGAIGVEVSGTGGLAVAANGSGSKQHANGNSATAVNTTVSATNGVTITAPGKTTLNGATVTGNRVTVDTGNLEITSPQDSSHYNSSTSQAGFGVKIPVIGSNGGVGGNYANQKIKDDYQSTGKIQSGIYAGNDGLNVHVGDTTHLKGGVSSSTADASKNHLDTGKLIAENQENHSKWNATSTGGGLNIGSGSLGSALGPLGVVAGNLAANSGLISGTQRKHNETSITQSAITSNITVNAGSTEGSYTTDVNNANGHLENKFDAEKLSNQLQNSQLGMQLVGEVMGQISDALHDSGVPGFDETKVSNDWGRILLEAGGSAAVARATGGNVGAATGSSVAGNIASSVVLKDVYDWAKSQSNGDENVARLLTNAIENIVASAGGAAVGGAITGGSGALNGADISSALQQYNMTQDTYNKLKYVEWGLAVGNKAVPNPYVKTGTFIANLIIQGILWLDPVDQPNQNVNQNTANESSQKQDGVSTDKKDEASVSGGSSGGNITPPDDNDGDEKTQLTPEQQQIIKNAENVSTADPSKGTYNYPRDLQEQVWWNQVKKNPTEGEPLDGKNDDPRFPESAGFKKMQARYKNTDGKSISIHYQYNSITGRVYDMKVTSPQRVWNNPTDVMNAMKGANK